MFLLAVAVDDLLMGVTHVIRGDDLLASAPRNAAVIEALGGTPPAYAHVPQVNGADGKPLSKRHGSTSVEAFREQGILPEALMNYLALLGWSKDAETTFLSKQELIEAFELERVSKNPARFDTEKLEWMNNHYVQSLEDDDLASRCLHFLSVAGLSPDLELLRRAMPLVKERMRTLSDSVRLLRFLFTDDITPDEKAADVIAKAPGRLPRGGRRRPRGPGAVDGRGDQGQARRARGRRGPQPTKGFAPVRAAVTGSTVSPPLPESLELLGRERTVDRLRRSREAAARPRGRVRAAAHRRPRRGRRAPGPGDVSPHVVWKKIPFGAARKRQMAAYSRRHYGERTYELTDPQVVVEHYTDGTSFDSAWNHFAANGTHLGEKPGVCAHFLIDTDGTIYQLVNLRIRCRHAIGMNWTAIGIEHVGTNAAGILGDHAMMRASLRLTVWLMFRYGISFGNVIGHAEMLQSPFHHELYRPGGARPTRTGTTRRCGSTGGGSGAPPPSRRARRRRPAVGRLRLLSGGPRARPRRSRVRRRPLPDVRAPARGGPGPARPSERPAVRVPVRGRGRGAARPAARARVRAARAPRGDAAVQPPERALALRQGAARAHAPSRPRVAGVHAAPRRGAPAGRAHDGRGSRA